MNSFVEMNSQCIGPDEPVYVVTEVSANRN